MISVPNRVSIYVMHEPVSFRKGIDGLSAVVRQILLKDPMGGSLFVFRSKTGKAVRVLCYDGGGFWLCTRRLSQGIYRYWPKGNSRDPSSKYLARELQVLLWGGNPSGFKFPENWQRVS